MPYRRRRGMRGLGDCTDPSNWDPDVCGPNPLSAPPSPFIGPPRYASDTFNPVVPYNYIGPLLPGQTYAPPPLVQSGPVWPTSQTPPPSGMAVTQTVPCDYIGPLASGQAYPANCASVPSQPMAFNLNTFLQKYGLYIMLAAGGLFLFAMTKGGRRR